MKFSRAPKKDAAPRRRTAPREDDSLAVQSSQFRRNQTLSSFRQPMTEQESERQRLHQLARKRRKMGGIFLIVASVVLILALLLSQLVAQVSVTSGSTAITRAVETAPYELAINEYYERHPVERLRFALNNENLLASVASKHPEVKAINLSNISDMVHAQFSLTFREPIAGWQINNKQFYVDSDGVVFQQNYFATPKVQIVDDSGVSPQEGSAVASARLLSFVGRATHEAGERGYKVNSVTLPAGTTRQLEIRLEGVTPSIKVTIDRGAGEQLEDADRAWKYLQQRGRSATYIDVRTEGRAVYR